MGILAFRKQRYDLRSALHPAGVRCIEGERCLAEVEGGLGFEVNLISPRLF